eukprot:m.97728 g.97728  ORF g.97728 m.97728 type:complete len:470 (+) comp15540_c0_seq1:156-1565(+)
MADAGSVAVTVPERRQRVVIIGAGAAGMAAAWSLSRFPDKYDVHVWEAAEVPGGVATSEDMGQGDWINDGVQGAAPSYHNTLLLHKEVGFTPHNIKMKVSFGKGDLAWNNVAATPLVEHHRSEIRRFGRVLKWINRLEFLFVFISIDWVLKLFMFSEDFRTQMVYPLTALFFGTGNQTANVSSIIIARVFLDPDLRLFEYNPETLLGETPDFMAFGSLRSIYSGLAEKMAARFHFKRPAAKVERTAAGVTVTDASGVTEAFDEVVFACSAELALKMIHRPTFWERWALGHVRYFDDVTLTHTDESYMESHYDVDPRRGDQYYIRVLPQDRRLVEMSFDLSNYQAQLVSRQTPRKIYQTIFLDATRKDTWSIANIDKSKVLLEKWWRQFAHTPGHFFFTVPTMRFIQGKQHSWFCGAYTLFNTHEMAVISGLAVAERLGAPYPFTHDAIATKQFDTLLKISHGVRRRRVD